MKEDIYFLLFLANWGLVFVILCYMIFSFSEMLNDKYEYRTEWFVFWLFTVIVYVYVLPYLMSHDWQTITSIMGTKFIFYRSPRKYALIRLLRIPVFVKVFVVKAKCSIPVIITWFFEPVIWLFFFFVSGLIYIIHEWFTRRKFDNFIGFIVWLLVIIIFTLY